MRPSRLTPAAIVSLSAGMGLLSLVALRWLGFVGLPPVLFLTLLLAGMPVGAVLLLRTRRLRTMSLGGIALLAASLSVVSLAAFPPVLQWLSPRVELSSQPFQSILSGLFFHLLAAAAVLLPLFVGYGLAELAAYRAGLASMQGRSGRVYALVLAGLLLAFGAYRLLLVELGTSGLGLVGLACLLLSATASLPRWWLALFGTLLCVGLLLVPGREQAVVSALEVKSGRDTVAGFLEAEARVVHDAWTPHCRLTMVDTPGGLAGFYDGIFFWFFPRGMPPPRESPASYRRPDLAFANLIRPGDRVAVLGAGGGVQVAAALRAGAEQVVAVEVVPEVLRVLAGPLADRVEHVYDHPRVKLVPRNARRYLEDREQPFDLLVVASVESTLGGMRDFFEPSQMLFTREALDLMIDRLAPGGILAVSKYTAVDRRGVVFRQVWHQLERTGLRTRGYLAMSRRGRTRAPGYDDLMARGVHYLIVAQKPGGRLDALASLDNLFRGSRVQPVPCPSSGTSLPEITDDRAFATGLLIANLGRDTLAAGIGSLAGLLLALGAVLLLLMRRTGCARPESVSVRARGRSLAAAAVGFNFMAIEYLLVYRLMAWLDIPMDATFLGMVIFIALAAAGGLWLTPHRPGPLLVVAWILGAVMVLAGWLAPSASFLAVAAAAPVTGALFPRLLRGSDREIVRVYTWDAYGTLWGGLAAWLIPLFAGFSGLQLVAGLALGLSALGVHRAAGTSETAA